MKVLFLHCVDCHQTKLIRAATVDAVMAKIDESEWVDLPNDLPPELGVDHTGHQAARCPACYAAHWSAFPREA